MGEASKSTGDAMINEELAQTFERMARVIAFERGDRRTGTAQLEHIR